jgi:hypothetical protein
MGKPWYKIILTSNMGKCLKQCHMRQVSLYFIHSSSLCDILLLEKVYHIVMYRGFYSRWKFISIQKLNTLQLVTNSLNTRACPTSTISEQELLTLHQNFWSPICSIHNPDRHPLSQFVSMNSQSCNQELTKHTRTIHYRAIGPLAWQNSISACSLSLNCHLLAPTIDCLHRPL